MEEGCLAGATLILPNDFYCDCLSQKKVQQPLPLDCKIMTENLEHLTIYNTLYGRIKRVNLVLCLFI